MFDVNNIIGAVASFPTNPAWGVLDRDTTITLSKNPKLVIYFANSTCLSCELHELKHWRPIISQIDSLQNEGVLVDLLFIFDTDRDNKLVQRTIAEQNFTYPVMYDEQGEFERNNVLPENSLMRAFFLDADNKIIYVGNPLLSRKHEKVFNTLFVGFGKKQH